MKNVENVYRRENGNKFYILGPKNSKDEKVKSWIYLRIENLKIIWKLEFGKLFLKSRMKDWKMTHGH